MSKICEKDIEAITIKSENNDINNKNEESDGEYKKEKILFQKNYKMLLKIMKKIIKKLL